MKNLRFLMLSFFIFILAGCFNFENDEEKARTPKNENVLKDYVGSWEDIRQSENPDTQYTRIKISHARENRAHIQIDVPTEKGPFHHIKAGNVQFSEGKATFPYEDDGIGKHGVLELHLMGDSLMLVVRPENETEGSLLKNGRYGFVKTKD